MAQRRNLNSEIRKILREPWSMQRSRGVPRPEDLGLDNHGKTIDAAVIYADLDESTRMADTRGPEFAVRMYKTYPVCAARVARSEQGNITAYDGDRVMAVYTGRRMVERAVRSTFKLNYVVQELVNPAVQELVSGTRFTMRQCVGVDTSELLVAKTGIRTANDLVWVAGRRTTRPSCPPVARPLRRSRRTFTINSLVCPHCRKSNVTELRPYKISWRIQTRNRR